ncbi:MULTISPECIES: substrate-binding periplasmic protein [Thalassospira]|uniref:Transporter substrate-binding domain-containing protein n=1 Tax=Thalassospira aquimaris TaxID=3037796 RepID=A0ABT6GB86_9PROT|nr:MULTISPECIES: transporter substrate-binding domain-containing protein [Thalassospira]MDG4719332.1 transporter substrate-binding domain-containing protein [Thalassospira sp. FZY0004]
MVIFTASVITRRKSPRRLTGVICAVMIGLCVVMLANGPARAYDQTFNRGNHGYLIAAFSVWEPFVIEGEDGTKQGIDVALLAEIANRLGLILEFYPCPWRRCLKTLEDGQIDVLTSFAYTDERAKFAHYITPPYSQVTPVFYVNRDNPVPIEEYGDLRNLMIGSVVDSRYFEPFDSDSSLDKFEAGSEMILLRMLNAKRIDTIVGSDSNADFEIRRNHLEGTIIKAPFRSGIHNDIHMVVSRKSPLMARVGEISQIMQDLFDEGFIDQLHQQYWPDKGPGPRQSGTQTKQPNQ